MENQERKKSDEFPLVDSSFRIAAAAAVSLLSSSSDSVLFFL